MTISKTIRFLALAVAFLFTVTPLNADTIKDALDTQKDQYTSKVTTATSDLTKAFDDKIKAMSQTGDITAVQELQKERDAFVSSKELPTASSMRVAVAQYQSARTNAESQLMASYETAMSDYTKAGKYDDAQLIQKLIAERFLEKRTEGASPTTAPVDPILTKLQSAKQDFVGTVLAAHKDVLTVIDARLDAASAKGDLDGFKQLQDWRAIVVSGLLVPDEVKDSSIRNAGAKFLRIVQTAFNQLQTEYRTAISDYTKAKRIDEAEAVKSEMQDGGWFEAYSREQPVPLVPSPIDLLQKIDIARDTIRKGWVFNGGVLQSNGWDDDHGPLIKIPVKPEGRYDLQMSFVLTQVQEAIYVRVPIGDHAALVAIASQERSFENIQGHQLLAHSDVAINQPHDAKFTVSYPSKDQVSFSLIIDGRKEIEWSGPSSQATDPGPVFGPDDGSCFAIDTKSGRISAMTLRGAALVKTP